MAPGSGLSSCRTFSNSFVNLTTLSPALIAVWDWVYRSFDTSSLSTGVVCGLRAPEKVRARRLWWNCHIRKSLMFRKSSESATLLGFVCYELGYDEEARQAFEIARRSN